MSKPCETPRALRRRRTCRSQCLVPRSMRRRHKLLRHRWRNPRAIAHSTRVRRFRVASVATRLMQRLPLHPVLRSRVAFPRCPRQPQPSSLPCRHTPPPVKLPLPLPSIRLMTIVGPPRVIPEDGPVGADPLKVGHLLTTMPVTACQTRRSRVNRCLSIEPHLSAQYLPRAQRPTTTWWLRGRPVRVARPRRQPLHPHGRLPTT
mmetsp:Transcript_17555/g.53064  ORF Transcript_17555/g.53064 Transcript_17555/m.53064 type:complete len:204 (-) Transcript_17555:2034-2645(-)